MKLALFPLSIFLLPGGRNRLKIFEPRYKRLVSEALSSGNGFGICLASEDNNLARVATRVKIIDFDSDQDGLLNIDIEGVDRFIFNEINTDKDGLIHTSATFLLDWDNVSITDEYAFLADSLQKILASHPLHADQDNDIKLNNLTWVCQRWVEILPIALEKKYLITQQKDVSVVIDFVKQIVLKN